MPRVLRWSGRGMEGEIRNDVRHMKLRYGLNPQQVRASAEPIGESEPISILNGNPGFINLLDVLNAWQLVRDASQATGLTAAASFKHVSPAGVGLAVPLPAVLAAVYEVADTDLSPAALAYVRARGADPKSSYGDMVAVSAKVDVSLATFLAGTVSDGIIAPDYEPAALDVLRAKKGGSYLVVRADPHFDPPARESRQVFGMELVQDRDNQPLSEVDLSRVVCGVLTSDAKRDLLLALSTVRFTQSNSVAYALGGQIIGIGAGQQSRVDCTKLAGTKADTWWLLQHPKVRGLVFRRGVRRQDRINWRVRFVEGDLTQSELTILDEVLEMPPVLLTAAERQEWMAELKGVSLASDGFLPFPDNIEQAHRHGVAHIVAPGGGTRQDAVEATCRGFNMALVLSNRRFFHH